MVAAGDPIAVSVEYKFAARGTGARSRCNRAAEQHAGRLNCSWSKIGWSHKRNLIEIDYQITRLTRSHRTATRELMAKDLVVAVDT